MSSKILDDILGKRNRTVNLKVVFVDVTSYSKRRSSSQADVIDLFMRALDDALKYISQEYVTYAQENDLNFQKDIICIPSGDGAAVAFPFDGLHDVHLKFAKRLLKYVDEHNEKEVCDKFLKNGWCNCHANFNLAIGISEGKGIIYRDVNSNYNIAGNAINLAARVMGLAEKNQIMLTEEAYEQLVDLVDDANFDEKFTPFQGVKIKHDLEITVYQYTDLDDEYVNCDSPERLELQQQAKSLKNAMQKSGFVLPDFEGNLDEKKMIEIMGQISALFSDTVDQAPELNIIKPFTK